ncbi:MAG: ATP-binding protein [bacterium]|nr:ATP-binding protein [bacterium]
MIKRHLENICFDEIFDRQMRFIAGPRQVGKTTLAKNFLETKCLQKLYFNWDLREVRDRYRKDPYFFETLLYDSAVSGEMVWVCMDEIHKIRHWKNILKDYFDKFERDGRFIITGSARLDWFKKSGDSLAGRYFLFKLFPLSLSEVVSAGVAGIVEEKGALEFIEQKISKTQYHQEAMEQLLAYSGYPEPFLKANPRFHQRWKNDLLDRLVREDIRDLTKIIETEKIATIIQLMPERVGSPLSLNGLKEDIGISYNAVTNAVKAMQLTYIIFLISPYSHKIARAIRKEKKAYFFDWTRCTDEAARFENYIAVELKVMTELWNDSGIGGFGLHYVRTKDGKESDFLITREGNPWCLFEVKSKDKAIAAHHYKHSHALGDIPVVQLTREANVLKKNDRKFYRVSASRFFG